MSSDQVSENLLLPIRRTALVGKQQGGQGGQGGQGRRARGEILSDPVTPRCVLHHRALHHCTLHGSLGIGKFELLSSSPTSTSTTTTTTTTTTTAPPPPAAAAGHHRCRQLLVSSLGQSPPRPVSPKDLEFSYFSVNAGVDFQLASCAQKWILACLSAFYIFYLSELL